MSRSPSNYIAPASATPAAPGSAVPGTSLKYAREDHVHPPQTSVTGSSGSATGNAGTATALQTAHNINGVSFDGTTDITVPPGTPTITPSTPTRVLGTAFQVSTTKAALCIYSVQIACTASLSGGQAGQVQLLSDASNPPTTVRVTVANQNTSALTIGLTVVNNQTAALSYIAKPNDYVLLKTTNTTGTPSYTLVSQTEETLG